ncbi:MAG TPA: serine protease [Elusimicrobia bacterium]|nr:MAG: hypothetical protein A2X37_08180 [Elusimicrobia bacterium GWA2_66_18]HAZ08542.1 serine protease [Elusimicrobiota bacterium]
MNKRPAAALFLAMTVISGRVHAGFEPQVIYGSDDRLDLYQVQDRKLLELADSTVGLFMSFDVRTEGDKAVLFTHPYGEKLNLCKEEPFWEQNAGAFCSGALVGPDVILTAGHCLESELDCSVTKFVFGFAMTKAGEQPASVDINEVYRCVGLLGRETRKKGPDWALVKLDRPVENHAVLKLDMSGTLANGDPVFSIGHPAGLPKKIVGGGKVRDISPQGFFVAAIDAYGGDSGSPVFNAKNGLLEGILVAGERDFIYKGDCRVSKVCAEDDCRGEDVTKLSSVAFPRAEAAATARLNPLGERLSKLLEQQAATLIP